MGNGELYVGEVTIQQVHVVPGNNTLGEIFAKVAHYAHHELLDSGRKRAEQAAHTNLRTQQAQLAGAGVR